MRGYYVVWFTNVPDVVGRPVAPGDIQWHVTVAAESEADALRVGLADARALNRGFGLPPHGIRVTEAELQELARVQPLMDL